MEETPPRRRRPPPRDDGPSLPFIPIVLGVIVLGFVIGAGLSVAQHHPSAQDVTPVATSTPAPVAEATSPAFAPAATPRPRATAKPTARAVASPSSGAPKTSPPPSPEASPPVSPDASAPASAAGSAAPTATAAPAATAAVTVTLAPGPASATPRKPLVAEHAKAPATAEPPAAAPPTAAPPTAAPATAAPATATPATVVHDDVTSDFGRLAAGVVRSYLAAIARGDTDGAYAQLGTAPNVSVTPLPEIGIVTRATRIVHVEARGGEDSVTVNVDMQTPGGAYFGQYTVHRSPSGAAIIVQHAIFKS